MANLANCAVCLQPSEEAVTLPCCGREGSSMVYCRGCVEIICQLFGRCPSCRQHLRMESGVVRIENRQQCFMCRGMHILVGGMCASCNLGRTQNFRYECNRCHAIQSIPHPMYRSQRGPRDYSGWSWACHQGCNDYTHWRIIPEDARQVPEAECPESWGNREDWLPELQRP